LKKQQGTDGHCPTDSCKRLDPFEAKTDDQLMIPMRDANAESFKMWSEDEHVYGPVDTATLIQWIQDDRVLPETFVQPQSDQRWRPAADVEALRGKLPAAAKAVESQGDGSQSSMVDILREFPVFAGLTTAGLEQIAALGKAYEVAPGNLVVRQGDDCDAIFFLLAGELRVRLIIGDVDRMDKTLCKLASGEFFGELGMFLQSKRTTDVIAETQSRVFRINTNAFQLLVKQIPELASPVLFNLGATMARRIAEDNERFTREVTSQFVWV
jgi:hypothetical protein